MFGPEFNSQCLQVISIFVTLTEAFAASYWMGNRVGSWGNNSRGVKLTTNEQLPFNVLSLLKFNTKSSVNIQMEGFSPSCFMILACTLVYVAPDTSESLGRNVQLLN